MASLSSSNVKLLMVRISFPETKHVTFNVKLLSFKMWTQRDRVVRAPDRPDRWLDLFSVVPGVVRRYRR